jgi:DNA mismatch repair protein MSH5
MVALALGANKYCWTAPIITEDNVVSICGGRHPLQELAVSTYVTNDCHLIGGSGLCSNANHPGFHKDELEAEPSMLVVTGPNHSGKSVYLKQVALTVYLAHIGSFVPAERATIGVTDKILTRISTRESVSRNESAFAIDLNQVAFAVKFASRRSLVLIDEFGKGTRPDDGAGLMTALLDHFHSLGPERPRVLAATHFHEIFESGAFGESDGVELGHMDVRVGSEQNRSEDQVTYLYTLAQGRSTSSFGAQCAALNGVDKAIVERAEAVVVLLARNEDLSAACAKLSPEEARLLEAAETAARGFMAIDDQEFEIQTTEKAKGMPDNAALKRTLQGILPNS